MSGNDAGKEGEVLKVFPEKNRIIVEKVNLIKRHTKANQNVAAGRDHREGRRRSTPPT